MFAAFFVFTLESKKIKIGHDLYTFFVTYPENLKIGH